jgi:subtilisin-like proprotein convertase family protein
MRLVLVFALLCGSAVACYETGCEDETVFLRRVKRSVPEDDQKEHSPRLSDPQFPQQWHLYDERSRNDVNVARLWEEGIHGEGVVVAVVDDGIDFAHPDLSPNYCPEGSYSFNHRRGSPMPVLRDDNHGTRCAGEIAAVFNNSFCGSGVAPKSRVSGLQILSGRVSDSMEASALSYARDVNHIYSSSWGPTDDGVTAEAPGVLTRMALEDGTKHGRKGLGSIFVFASGNGGPLDNCNFDGYANSIYTVTLGALDRLNSRTSYTEPCAARLAVTYSSGSSNYITTTDVHGGCTHKHSQTSAAAPLGAGILALVLQVRPDLTWRDVQGLLAHAAVKVRPDSGDWRTNGAGLEYSHTFGFGKMDAQKLVERARRWSGTGESVVIGRQNLLSPAGPLSIITGAPAVAVTTEIEHIQDLTVEHAVATITLSHASRGDVVITLTSPSGMVATLATRRPKDVSPRGLNSWNFSTVAFWGENPTGRWTLRVSDEANPGKDGALVAYSLALYLGTPPVVVSTLKRAGSAEAPSPPPEEQAYVPEAKMEPVGELIYIVLLTCAVIVFVLLLALRTHGPLAPTPPASGATTLL